MYTQVTCIRFESIVARGSNISVAKLPIRQKHGKVEQTTRLINTHSKRQLIKLLNPSRILREDFEQHTLTKFTYLQIQQRTELRKFPVLLSSSLISHTNDSRDACCVCLNGFNRAFSSLVIWHIHNQTWKEM